MCIAWLLAHNPCGSIATKFDLFTPLHLHHPHVTPPPTYKIPSPSINPQTMAGPWLSVLDGAQDPLALLNFLDLNTLIAVFQELIHSPARNEAVRAHIGHVIKAFEKSGGARRLFESIPTETLLDKTFLYGESYLAATCAHTS